MHIFLQIVLPNIANYLTTQGPTVTLMGIIVWYFWGQNKQLTVQMQAQNDKHDAAIAASNDKLENYMSDDRQKLIQVIVNNTEMMQEVKDHLKDCK